uniref:Uncharacterized protein n=1 Tax=Arundo donax TaxID=35708 RepID=A0A0A9EBB4_ARUDO
MSKHHSQCRSWCCNSRPAEKTLELYCLFCTPANDAQSNRRTYMQTYILVTEKRWQEPSKCWSS